MCNLCRTLGLLPPMAPGLIDPVSWYRQRILDTQPWETRSCREMTHGLMPWWAISTILWRMWLGRGLPFMKTPPSWFTRPWPNGVETILPKYERNMSPESSSALLLQNFTVKTADHKVSCSSKCKNFRYNAVQFHKIYKIYIILLVMIHAERKLLDYH